MTDIELAGVELASRAGRPRDDAREQAILDAAIELVAEVGYDRLTMDGVAARARASKATIYRRWPGKAELVVDALKRRVPHPFEIPDLGSLEAELEDVMRQVCMHIDGLDGNLLCGLAGACHDDAELASCFKQMMNEKQSPIESVVARAVARGELPPGSAHQLIDEVIPAVAVMHSLQAEPFDEAFVAHLVYDIALPLLGVTPMGAATTTVDLIALDPAPPDVTTPELFTAELFTPYSDAAKRAAKESR
jgi:AcrR family transcriptional regulator